MRCRLGVLLSLMVISGSLLGCTDPAYEKAKAEKTKKKAIAPGPVDPDAPEEFTTTPSGLKYRIRRKATGKLPTSDEQLATINYRGWLDDGFIFDGTYGTTGSPKQYVVGGGLPGWVEGLKMNGEGGMIELEIPSNLAYGERGFPPHVPANTTVHFLIETLKYEDPPKQPEINTPHQSSSPGASDPDAPEEYTTTESGLKYRIRRKSNDKKPTADSTVYCHYRGWLENGTEFDSSYKKGQPVPFPLQRVVAGFREGVLLIGKGGMIELEVPSDLGYGPQGQPPQIPPNATLHFLIELIGMN